VTVRAGRHEGSFAGSDLDSSNPSRVASGRVYQVSQAFGGWVLDLLGPGRALCPFAGLVSDGGRHGRSHPGRGTTFGLRRHPGV
jgi:hypothetical protein